MTQTDCCAGQSGPAAETQQLLFDFQVGIMNVTESWST